MKNLVVWMQPQAIFGFGVGGEYPVASTSASERAEASSTLVHRRGETVVMVFSMQVQYVALCVLLRAQGF